MITAGHVINQWAPTCGRLNFRASLQGVIVGAAVCPGAPFLVDGVADAIAGRLSAVSAACRHTLALLPDSDAVLLLTTGAADVAADPALPWRLLVPGTIVSSAPVRRSDLASEVPSQLEAGAAQD